MAETDMTSGRFRIEDQVALLKSLPLFQGLPENHLRILAESSRVEDRKAGDMVAVEGDKVRGMYVVATGRLKMFKSSAEGKEQTLYVLGAGEPFCVCTSVACETYPAGVAALENSRLLHFPAGALEALAQREPSLLLNMLALLSSRLGEALRLVESLALKEVPQRLAAFLLHAADPEEGDAVDLRVTHRELAKILGATPETLSRAFRRLGEMGLAEVQGRKVAILNRKGLEELEAGE
jgi:CRP/FNR family transcriptional regulator, dissimilatory nitrate respiration regulator